MKLKLAVKNCPHGEKPKPVKTHLRNCIIMPEMVGSICEVYSGKYWNPVEIKTDMVGDYLGEYSMTYKPIRHGKVGVGATRGSKFVSIKWTRDALAAALNQTLTGLLKGSKFLA